MMGTPAVHGVLVTFRRPTELVDMLQRLSGQTRQFDTLTVVDNDNDPRTKLLAESCYSAPKLEYIPAADNLGPAGGLALGARHVLEYAADADWVMFLDDDDPPPRSTVISDVIAFGERIRVQDPLTAAVGLVGTRFNLRTGMATPLSDEELNGPVSVDYIGGNQFPCYRVSAVRQVGVPNARLFFGFEELEYGLRFRRSGQRLYVDGNTMKGERRAHGRLGIDRQPSRRLKAPVWRDYYRTRNIVWILRQHKRHLAAARFVGRRVLLKTAYNVPQSPRLAWRHMRLGTRATMDAVVGRMGRTVEPITQRDAKPVS